MLDKYLKLAQVANAVVYDEPSSVKQHNAAVDKMYSIVRNASDEELSKLYDLLEDSSASIWLAHQLVEVYSLPKSIEAKCFDIVQHLANQDSLNSFGEQLWLNEWANKRGRA